uniref:Uncharacterized protein n=1 Tax=Sphaerodactylus townsendi TaxID=933632 RepID=A0ACB8EVG6_9SAUR
MRHFAEDRPVAARGKKRRGSLIAVVAVERDACPQQPPPLPSPPKKGLNNGKAGDGKERAFLRGPLLRPLKEHGKRKESWCRQTCFSRSGRGQKSVTTDIANSLIRRQMDCSRSLAHKAMSRRASQLECGSVDTAQAGWFASSIQSKWNLGGDSIVKLADSGSMVCDGMRFPVARRHSVGSWAGRYAAKSMRWSLLPWLRDSVLQFGFPDGVVLQVGENGIPGLTGVALRILMETDLSLLRCTMPKTKLFGRAY